MAGGKCDKRKAARPARNALSVKLGLPGLIAMTDASRAPDPFEILERLPQEAMLVWRIHETDIPRAECLKLARAARMQHCRLLVTGSLRRASLPGIGGMHLAERVLTTPYTDGFATRLRWLRPGFIVTAATHSQRAIVAAARAGVDAVLISPVFPTKSHPGAAVLGVTRFAHLAHFAASLGLAAYALGGVVDKEKMRRLRHSGAKGIAGIGFFIR